MVTDEISVFENETKEIEPAYQPFHFNAIRDKDFLFLVPSIVTSNEETTECFRKNFRVKSFRVISFIYDCNTFKNAAKSGKAKS